MKLSDRDIIKNLEEGNIGIDPKPNLKNITGVSVDLSLGNRFRTYNNHNIGSIDVGVDSESIKKNIDLVMSEEIIVHNEQKFYLHPGELALAYTNERITIPNNLVGWIEGRSSLARLGLMVHATANRIDPGWEGQIVLEIYNCGKLPLGLSQGLSVCALCFEPLTSPCIIPYNLRQKASYKNQVGPQSPILQD